MHDLTKSAIRDRSRTPSIPLRTPLALLLISLGPIAAVWWWLATPVTLALAPIDPAAKLDCVSYAPFRKHQTPWNSTAIISAATDRRRSRRTRQGVQMYPHLFRRKRTGQGARARIAASD